MAENNRLPLVWQALPQQAGTQVEKGNQRGILFP